MSHRKHASCQPAPTTSEPLMLMRSRRRRIRITHSKQTPRAISEYVRVLLRLIRNGAATRVDSAASISALLHAFPAGVREGSRTPGQPPSCPPTTPRRTIYVVNSVDMPDLITHDHPSP